MTPRATALGASMALSAAQDVTTCLRLFRQPGEVVELRAIHVTDGRGRPYTMAGFYDHDHLPDMAQTALELSKSAKGVYFTLNPLQPAILARCCNRVQRSDSGSLAGDSHVAQRCWLLIDADPVRPVSDVAATDGEKKMAHATTQWVYQHLARVGWPRPIVADSGNGYHLLYRIDLPANDDGLVERVLKALAQRFDNGQVTIDQKVSNPARICKLYGTMARKGDHTEERPHRMSRVLVVPDSIQPVPTELLKALAGEFKEPEQTRKPSGTNGAVPLGGYTSRLLVERWLTDRKVSFREKNGESNGRTVFVLQHCPFNPDHGDPDSCIMQDSDGKMSAQCYHNSCAGHGWQDFKTKIGPPGREHFDPPLSNEACKPTIGRSKANGKLEAPEAANGTPKSSCNGSGSPTPDDPKKDRLGILLSEVQSQRVAWLWPGRVPLGKLTILDGDPGLGKSTIALDLAARISRGWPMPMEQREPGDDREPAGVLLLTAEDGLDDTVVPRIEAAGGDRTRILALDTIPDRDGDGGRRLPALPDDADYILAAAKDIGAKLIIVDPLMAYLGGDVNSHRDQDVRRALWPLAKIAEETGAAVLVIRHLNKMAGGSALHRGGGSIGISGAARSVLLAAKDPDFPDTQFVLASTKSNLGRRPPSISYAIDQAATGGSTIRWIAESHHSAEGLVAAPTNDEERGALAEATAFLRDQLLAGPRPAKEVKGQAAQAGITAVTLGRAKALLRVKAEKLGYGTGATWKWSLPPEGDQTSGFDNLRGENAQKRSNSPENHEGDQTCRFDHLRRA